MTTTDNISVVVPVYNSFSTLDELAQRVFKVFDELAGSHELVLVDDGSEDESWNTIAALKQKYGERLKGIKLAKNFGQHNALCCGFFHASGSVVVTMDDDLQHPPEEIPKLVNCFHETGADLVYGMPADTRKNAIRKLGSVYVRRTSAFYKKGGKGGSPFRLIKKELVQKIIANHNHHFIYIDAILNWYTSNMAHVVVNFDVRRNGKSGYTLYKLLRLYADLTINYSANPLKWITRLGFISAAFSILLAALFIYRKFAHAVPVGYTSIIVAVLFGTGLILLSLGMIGQYIFKMYQLQYHKPTFYVEKTL